MDDTVDPILLEVINNALTAIGDEMGNTMKRTARSITARIGDFSTVLVDARGRVIAQGQGAGFHLGYIRGVMPAVLKKFAGKLRPGDILASNDPYGGLSHLPDIVLLAPIFWHETMIGFSTLVTHHSDIGGRFPGGQSSVCSEIYEEGLRLPCVKLYEEGRPNQALLDVIAGNVRTPDDVIGDLEGQAAACRRGIRGLQELVDKYGLERFETAIAQLHRYSERVVRAAIMKIPDGEYVWDEHFEEDGVGGPGIHLKLCLKVRGDSVIVDFTGTDPQVKSAINVPYSLTCSASYICLRGVLAADAPANDGLFEPVEVIAPKGTVLNPHFPAAIGGRGMMLWRICDMMFGALAKAMPERIFAAGEGGVASLTYAYSGGEPGASPVLTDWYGGGWGARPTKDGIDGVNSLLSGNGGSSVPVERLEVEFPLLMEAYGLMPDTGGAGKYRGSLSVYRTYRFLKPGRALIRTCRTTTVPYGLGGGGDGTPFRVVLDRAGTQTDYPPQMFVDAQVQTEDAIMHLLPGAGGYGDALDRDPAMVLNDVLDEKISSQCAQRVYGVVIDADAVDGSRTHALRDAMRRARG
ncbi:MAG TPA: hydantoinase B/oxoprolinase family protein [Candidatus Binataceae bacterium]|nr:hydantoinase B/oxoprolinase family protein [Candidatus Binataceae bacterium]